MLGVWIFGREIAPWQKSRRRHAHVALSAGAQRLLEQTARAPWKGDHEPSTASIVGMIYVKVPGAAYESTQILMNKPGADIWRAWHNNANPKDIDRFDLFDVDCALQLDTPFETLMIQKNHLSRS